MKRYPTLCHRRKIYNILTLVSLTIMLLIIPSTVQGADYNVFGQILGPSAGYGIGYDTRFKCESPFGYSIGIAYSRVSYRYDISNESTYNPDIANWIDCNSRINSKGITIPVEFNYLIGKRNSKLEVGVGITPFIGSQWYSKSGWDSENDYEFKKFNDVKRFRIRGMFSASIGYRLQRSNGFFMRLGITACLGGGKSITFFKGFHLLPNICLGYTIHQCR